MTPEARRAQGIAARALLDDGTAQAVLTEIRADVHAEWEAARWPRTRERLHAELRGIDRFQQRLATMAGQAPR